MTNKKAPKILHDILDDIYDKLEKKREYSNKNGLPKTISSLHAEMGQITPIPFKSPHAFLGLLLSENNPPKYDN
jgi:hypothetical protein